MSITRSGNPSGRRRVGLVLCSGVARGWAHIDAIRALTRLGVPIDIVAGCSAGALVCGCWLARKLDALEQWALALNKRKVTGYLDLNLGRGGVIKGAKIVPELRRLLGPLRIEGLHMPFVAVTTDLVTGHEVWLRTGDLAEAVRASFSLPGLFPPMEIEPMEIEQRWLADSALVEPLLVSACRALGADLVIAINLNTDTLGKARRAAIPAPAALGFDPALLDADARLRGAASRELDPRHVWSGRRPAKYIWRHDHVAEHHARPSDALAFGWRSAGRSRHAPSRTYRPA